MRLSPAVTSGLNLGRVLQRSPLTAPLYRPFASLSRANEALAAYANRGHENAAGLEFHLRLNETARPSDDPARQSLVELPIAAQTGPQQPCRDGNWLQVRLRSMAISSRSAAGACPSR